MPASPAPQTEPITDSPWFWIYLFATAALVLLMVFRPKMDIRQAEIERQHQARQIAAQHGSSVEEADAADSPVEISSPGNTRIGLNYIYAVLGLLIGVGWARLWYVRFRRTGPPLSDKGLSRAGDKSE